MAVPKNLTLKVGHQETGGFAGVNFNASNNKLKANQSPKCSNYIANKKGLITRKGSFSQNDTEIVTDTGISGMVRFYDGQSYHTIAKCGTTLWDVQQSTTHQALVQNLTDAEIHFERWLGNYFFIDGNDLYCGTQDQIEATAVTLSDQDGTALAGEKPTGKFPVLHNGRMWWFGGSSTPYFSEVDYYDRYLTLDDPLFLACRLSCDENDGQDLVAALSYNGKLICWKREKMFFITGDWDPYSGTIPEVTMYTSTGVYNQKGVIRCADGFIRGYGPEGVFQYSDASGIVIISEDVKDELNQIAFEDRDKVCVGWCDGLFMVFYPMGLTTSNNRCLAFDPLTGDWIPFDGWNVSCTAHFEDDWLYAGWSDKGYIKKMFEGYNDDGNPIATYYETKYIVLPAEYYMDKLVVGIANGEGEVKISWICDTLNSASITKSGYEVDGQRLADETRPDLGGFMLADEDLALVGSYLVDEVVLTRNFNEYKARMKPGQRFKKIKFIFESNSMDEHQIDYLEVYLILARQV